MFALAFLLSVGVKALAGQVENDNSGLHSVTGVVGASVSGVFLWMLGHPQPGRAARASSRCSARCAPAGYDEAELEDHLNKRGFMNRFLGGLTKSVRKAWHIYPIGVLFGLGFDTATEVGLLVLAGGAAAFNLPFYAILVLPILFAAGMCLMDTIDGVFMNAAYGWAFAKPVRKVFYNITITSISVAVALIIGTIELVGVLADQAKIDSGPLVGHRVHPARLRRLRDRRVLLPRLDHRPRRLAVRPHRGEVVGEPRPRHQPKPLTPTAATRAGRGVRPPLTPEPLAPTPPPRLPLTPPRAEAVHAMSGVPLRNPIS